MKMETIFKNRRGVGGLISLVGLVLVFSISSVAYLDLSSTHANLISTTSEINQKVLDSALEKISFTNIVVFDATTYRMDIENLGSNSILLKAYVAYDEDEKEEIGKGSIEEIISPGGDITNFDISVDDTSTPTNDNIFFITETGKKCLIQGNVGTATC